jgi:transposase
MNKNFIGIDVSKLTLDVYLHNQSQHNVFSNDIDGFKLMLDWLKQLKVSVKSMAICFEHTGIYSEDLSVFLSEKKICFYMESSLNIKYSIGLQRGKNDKIDSKRIANFIALHAEHLSPTVLSKSAVTQLRKLLSMRSHLEKEKISIKNRLKNSSKSGALDIVFQIESDLLKTFNDKLKLVEEEIKSLIKSDDNLRQIDELVQSIKGVGPVSSWYLIATTNGFEYFDNARQYACYSGIAPFEKSSGTSIKGKTQTDRRSNRKINGVLTMAARSAVLNNIEMREYMERKIQEGKHYNCALNAVKNKLVSRVFAVVKRKTPYVDLKKYAA